jgi:DNA-binding NarL/FixJ family response regulator
MMALGQGFGARQIMTRPRIRVLCVDDSTMFTSAWERLLSRQEDMECAGSLDRADELLTKARDSKADVVLLDLTMVGRDPLEAMAELKTACPQIKVVVCSGYSDRGRREQATKAGASGYVDKVDQPSRILDTLRRVTAPTQPPESEGRRAADGPSGQSPPGAFGR